jgi:hypothetical protein
METLRQYYRDRLKVWVGIIAAAAILYRVTVAPDVHLFFQSHFTSIRPSLVDWVITTIDSALAGVLFLCGEWFIRTKLWKWENKSLNFSGRWKGETSYDAVEKESVAVTAQGFKPFAKEHEVLIDQDCLSIAIKPTDQEFVSWYSIAMDMRSADQIAYAYDVTYKNPGFPPTAIGYEEMNVTARRESYFGEGRPIKLSGRFYHCAQGTAPLYRGSVKFTLVR